MKNKIILILIFLGLLVTPEVVFAQDKKSDGSFELAKIRQFVEYKAGDLQDPFGTGESLSSDEKQDESAPQIVLPKEAPNFTIQGLFWGGPNPQAIINGKIVKVGDVIENATITSISKEGVGIFFDNREFALPAPAADTKKK